MGMSVDRSIGHSASVAGDLATQAVKLETADISDIMSATMRVTGVSDPENMTIYIQSFSKESDGTINNLGEAIYNASGEDDLPPFDEGTLGEELLSEDSGVVVARVRYAYKPLGLSTRKKADGKAWMPAELNFQETFLLKPRRSTEIEIVGPDTRVTCSGPYSEVSCSAGTTTSPGDSSLGGTGNPLVNVDGGNGTSTGGNTSGTSNGGDIDP